MNKKQIIQIEGLEEKIANDDKDLSNRQIKLGWSTSISCYKHRKKKFYMDRWSTVAIIPHRQAELKITLPTILYDGSPRGYPNSFSGFMISENIYYV